MFRSIRHFFYKIKLILRWIPVLWKTNSYDWIYIYKILGAQLDFMAEDFEKFGMCVDSDDLAWEMRKAAMMCRRIAKDEYIYSRFSPWGDQYYYAQDVDYLCHMLKRKGRRWWD
jgi:hypothetical protein